jgi:hypothetical protein
MLQKNFPECFCKGFAKQSGKDVHFSGLKKTFSPIAVVLSSTNFAALHNLVLNYHHPSVISATCSSEREVNRASCKAQTSACGNIFVLVANAVKHRWLSAALHFMEEDSIDSGVPVLSLRLWERA